MRSWILKTFCCVLIIAALVVDFSDSRRTRYGGTSVRTRVRVRQRVRVGYGSRVRYIRHGSGPFTRSNWQIAFLAGSIYGGSRYMRSPRYYHHRDRMPYICTNRFDRDRNGTVYGYFVCPRIGEPDDYDRCCGSSQREYCCRYFDDTGRTVGIVIGVLLFVAVIGIIVYCCCKRSGKAGQVLNKFHGRSNNRMTAEQCVPLKQEAPVMMTMTKPSPQPSGAYVHPPNEQPVPPPQYPPPGNQPQYPPPGNQPPPSGAYPPPAYPGGYDPQMPSPYQPSNEKQHLPSADVNTGGYPYPGDPGVMQGPPTPAGMPYPPDPNAMQQQQPPPGYGYGDGNAPYPPQPYPPQPAPPYPQ